jgi:hypothetical protein
VRPVTWAWLLPIVAGVAAWVFLTRDDPAPRSASGTDHVATFVAVDATGNRHDGIIQGPVQMGADGHEGKAFSFSQRGSWIMVPSSRQLNAEKDNFLVSVWIQVESNPDADETYDIVRKGVAYTVPGEFKLELLGDGTVRCSAKDDRSQVARVDSRRPLAGDGTWHQIGCARTGDQWSVIVDDAVKSTTVNLGAITNSVALSIGSKYGLEDRPIGLVDDVRLFIDRAGTTTTKDAKKAIRKLEDLDPVAWWPLDEEPVTGVAP